jgi:tyrosyl-tRNA synthetase
LTAPAGEIFGKIMSVPDRLVQPYFCALSEWRDCEFAVVGERLATATLHPMDLKKVLAGEVTAAIHGVEAAMSARDEFTSRFSTRTFAGVADLPSIDDLGQTVTDLVKALGFAKSNGEVRRVAEQNGLRIVVESDTGQDQIPLTADEAREPLGAVLKSKLEGRSGDAYLKVGRKLARINTAE